MTNIDEYIAAYDGEIKERMIALRALIHSCHPDITEKIAWAIPDHIPGQKSPSSRLLAAVPLCGRD